MAPVSVLEMKLWKVLGQFLEPTMHVLLGEGGQLSKVLKVLNKMCLYQLSQKYPE
jgi:hypothetical protein